MKERIVREVNTFLIQKVQHYHRLIEIYSEKPDAKNTAGEKLIDYSERRYSEYKDALQEFRTTFGYH